MKLNLLSIIIKKLLSSVIIIDSYPGLWEVPLVTWQCDDAGLAFGSTISECEDSGNEESVYQLIMRNFKLHYEDNKQPFPMFGDSFWLDNATYRKNGKKI